MKIPKWGRRKPEPGLAAEAARNPGGWVYEIDADWVDDPNGYVPPEAIKGGWKVDDSGQLTGEYVANENHGPPRDDFSALTEPDHWLDWLGDDPARTVRDSIELSLAEQVAGTKVRWLKITAEPKFQTGAKPFPDDPNRMQVVRTGLAVEFALSAVQPSGERDVLTGVYSLGVAGMDEAVGRERSWLDLGVSMEQIGPLLEERLYSLDQ